jgi:glutamate racemase
MQDSKSAVVGVFDSGIGGLSVLRAIRFHFPQQPVMYLADQAHVPYGTRSLSEVRRFSAGITRFLLEQGVGVIVVACNTASAAALHELRKEFPGIPFVGMEPAVKPAAAQTFSGVVGVLATPATFQGALYASVIERFANGVTVLQDPCPGLVAEVEAGRLNGQHARQILEKALLPMLERGLDTVVLGCTHYPYVIPLIKDIVGPDVQVIDPSPAIARQTGRILEANGLLMPVQSEVGEMHFFTTGNPEQMRRLLPPLLGQIAYVERLEWSNGELKKRE